MKCISTTDEIKTGFIIGISNSDSNILGHTGDRLPLRTGEYYSCLHIIDFEEVEIRLNDKSTITFIKSNQEHRFRHPYKNEIKRYDYENNTEH